MASKQMLAAVVAAGVVLVFLPAIASATDHVVGDDHGWSLGFDYDAWAKSKQLSAAATATEHWVGDDAGWKLNFNYTEWAATKQFRVGDTLVFKYSAPSHTVVEVSGADFAACNTAGASADKVLTTGQDRVTLDSAGRRWFACGVGKHCANGMKVRIDVLAASAADGSGSGSAAAAPAAPPPASGAVASNVQARLAQAVLAVIAAVLVL